MEIAWGRSVALPYLNAVRLLLEVHVGEPERLIKHTRRQVYITGGPSPSSEGAAIRAVSQSGNAGVPVRQSLRPETAGCLRHAHMGEARSNFPLPKVQYLRIPRHVDQRSEMMSISIPKWCRSAFRTEADQFYSCSSEQ